MLVDARPPQGYKAGHLAGATLVYWQETLVDPKQDPGLPFSRQTARLV